METRNKLSFDFVHKIHNLIDEWDSIKRPTVKKQLEGLAFSILALIDGCDPEMQGFKLIPLEEKYKGIDIAGNLHHIFGETKK